MSILDISIQLLGAFGGAVGFALLFNVQPRNLFGAGLGGFLGWAAFLFFGLWIQSEVLRFFLASICFTLYSDPLSRLKEVPSAVFLLPSAIPMVPGASLYRSMRYAVDEQWLSFGSQIFYTLLLAAAIAAGIVYAMTILHTGRKLWEAYRHPAKKKGRLSDSHGK